MLTIGLAEAQEKLGSLVELAELGETVCIMRRGKQVAQLTALSASETHQTLPEVRALPRWTAPDLPAASHAGEPHPPHREAKARAADRSPP